MESVFNAAGNAAILERINRLTADSKPLWGKMNIGQMLVHCQRPIGIAQGSFHMKGGLMAFLFGKITKRQLLKPGPYPHNSITAPEFRIKETNHNFELERKTLSDQVQAFAKGPASLASTRHPFFGEMTPQEWDIMQWKHLDHHLRQFGV